MYIYLLNRHEALVFNDRRDTITISNAAGGILTVNGKDYNVINGGKCPSFEVDNAPTIRAAFTNDDGIVYTVLDPRISKGTLLSRPDPYTVILTQRIQIDELEKGLEAANERIRKLEGMHEKRALNGLFKFKEV